VARLARLIAHMVASPGRARRARGAGRLSGGPTVGGARGGCTGCAGGWNGHSPNGTARRHWQRDGGADRGGDARGLTILEIWVLSERASFGALFSFLARTGRSRETVAGSANAAGPLRVRNLRGDLTGNSAGARGSQLAHTQALPRSPAAANLVGATTIASEARSGADATRVRARLARRIGPAASVQCPPECQSARLI